MILDNKPISDEDFKALYELVNSPLTAVKYLAIDPGKASGVCGYGAHLNLIFMYTIREEDMVKFLECFESVTTAIVEDYVLYPNKSKEQVYSDMQTSRVIGRIEGWAARHRVQLVKQKANIKPNGYAFIGRNPLPKSNPKNHVWDAHVHMIYWAVRTGKINARDLLNNAHIPK
jgi:hypothetical protein